MPNLDWEAFGSLPGSRERNFENLCRALVRLHFGSCGKFAALKNQPGVEFHLKLTNTCIPLGDPPRWYGWQCKFHSLTAKGNLTASSKKDIEDSMRKTEHHIPGLTDWVLWTPYTLSKKDQEWFVELQTPYNLHQWATEEIENYLNGPALILRSTYFGELIATPEELKRRHREAIRPITKRWLEPVHQPVEAERTIRRMLGESGSWGQLTSLGKRLKKAAGIISVDQEGVDCELAKAAASFVEACSAFADTLLNFHTVLADGDLDLIQHDLRERKTLIDAQVLTTPGRLRALNLPVALDATNALDDMRIAQEILDEVEELLGVGLVALLADAGGGKTQVAAQLTAGQGNRPTGVFLHGRNLHRGQTLDHLAGSFSLNGNPLNSMEKLLAAIDAAGKRAGCRLPVVIDGLSEAENPKDWKAPLASLGETVKHYPNVLVVCTLRTGEHRREGYWRRHQTQAESRESFAVMALPDDMRRIESEGFGNDAREAIQRYFNHFKIDPGDAEIPLDFLQHPLTLRIFCEVTNPDRASSVRIEYFPSSLASLFEKYVENVCERISQMPNLNHPYNAEDVARSIYQLGLELWSAGRRESNEQSFRQATVDAGRDWTSSIVNLLAQEGIIFRNPGREPYSYVVTPVYDALGGFIVANSLLKKYSHDREFEWLKEPASQERLLGETSHELAGDIFWSLVALTPRRMLGTQLWKVAPEPLRKPALRFATTLDPGHLDKDTIAGIREIMSGNLRAETRLLSRLQAARGVAEHPLNADFLGSILRPMGIAERDLSWTEWVRKSRDERLQDLLTLEQRWRENLSDRTPSDRLRARWIMWFLTSSDRELRDVATRAFYWFGRGAPSALFEDTIDSLGINDPYIPERMLAASYGVAMAVHGVSNEMDCRDKKVPKYARHLYESLFAKQAPFSTTHALMREYATRTIELVALCSPSTFTPEELERSRPPFADGGLRQWGGGNENSREELHGPDSPFHMDFENYTLGRLVRDRRNYDYKHEEYRKIRAQVLWRIERLGWSNALFNTVDNEITGEQYRPWMKRSTGKTERYGKKYSWIAFFEMAGLRSDLEKTSQEGTREVDIWDFDIDPSFPERPTKAQVIDTDFLGAPHVGTKDWIADGSLPDVAQYLRLPEVLAEDGPWIMLDGFAVQEDQERGRNSFCCIRSFLIDPRDADSFVKHLTHQDPEIWSLPQMPSFIYTFAGEIPWCSTFPRNGVVEFSIVTREETVKVQQTQRQFYLDDKELDQNQIRFILRRMLHKKIDETQGQWQISEEDMKRVKVREEPVEIEEVKRKYQQYEVLIPVCNFDWESYHSVVNDAGHATTLAKEVATALDLTGQPQTFDLFTRDRFRATRFISDQSDDYNNGQSMCFIREELLQAFLQKEDYSLIWVIWGERQYSSDRTERLLRGPDRPEIPYRYFGWVERYKW